METIIQYLKDHPCLNLSKIEKAINAPRRTIIIGRNIPTKYIEPLKKLLADYGYNNISSNEDKTIKIIKQSSSNEVTIDTVSIKAKIEAQNKELKELENKPKGRYPNSVSLNFSSI